MTNRKHHDTHQDRHGARPGIVRRVTTGLSERFGVPRKLVLAGFIVGLIINLPLTVVLFLVALYWVDYPGRLERHITRASAAFHRLWSRLNGNPHAHADAESSRTSAAQDADDLDFSDLRRQFEELERRAADMEAHVTSQEFHLNQEFGRMNRDSGRPA